MNNKTLAILPITTILLSGAKAGLPIQPPVGNDRLEYALISSGLKGYETNISLLASFSAKSKVNKVEVYKIKPVNLEYLLVTSLSAGNNISISTQVNVIEPYTKDEYNKVGLSGPRFKIVVTSTVGTINKYFDTYYRDYSNPTVIDTYDKGVTSFTSENSLFYYNGDEDYMRFISEDFLISDYAIQASYEFNNQNYIEIKEPLFKNRVRFSNHNMVAQFTYSNAYLEIYDANFYFPNLHKSKVDPTVIVLGELVEYKNGYGFRTNDNLYIDPLTRLTYRTNKKGRVKTSNLYLPIGAKRKESEVEAANQINIYVERAGFSKSKLKFTLNLGEFSSGLIGDCATSVYCVSFENTEPDFEIGDTFND